MSDYDPARIANRELVRLFRNYRRYHTASINDYTKYYEDKNFRMAHVLWWFRRHGAMLAPQPTRVENFSVERVMGRMERSAKDPKNDPSS